MGKRRVVTVLLFVAFAVGVYRTCRVQQHRPSASTGYAIPIFELQGAAHISPWSGREVVDVRGVVTAAFDKGFYLQDPKGDGDPRTSDAIFVFTSTSSAVESGDLVTVSGRVTEYTPGPREAWNLSLTEIVRPRVEVLERRHALPPPVRIG